MDKDLVRWGCGAGRMEQASQVGLAGAGVGAVHDNVDRSRAVWLCVGSA
jgi:hypothetical protein